VLRALLPFGELCPLTAQGTYEEGTIYYVQQWPLAGASQGLEAWIVRALTRAADDDEAADPDVRTRLLRICGMDDEATARDLEGTIARKHEAHG
jgi:hypothetical protein